MLKKGDKLNKRYEIIEEIGAGGMSVVYKARCHKLNRYVAIKTLREEYCMDENFVRRFKVEAQAAAGLSHPNIISIFDVGNEGNNHYIVMEYLEGKTLKEAILSQQQLTEEETEKISLAILLALAHAHSNHIIHRDIKPQNIILTLDGKIKVADFGIAHVASDKTLDRSDYLTGSVHYIAPEQAKGGVQDERSDLYSLGITMFEMVTGQVPFEGDNPVNIALQHLQEKLPDAKQLNSNISHNLIAIIEKAVAKKPHDRYQSATDMVHAIETVSQFPDHQQSYSSSGQGHTVRLKRSEVKHIWNKNERSTYSGQKDPYALWLKVGAIGSAFLIVALVTFLLFKTYAKDWLPQVTEVPKVVDLTLEQAETLLINKQLTYIVAEEVYNDVIPEGNVIRQSIAEGSSVEATTEVKLVISKGVEQVKIPTVLGIDYQDAEKILTDKEFKVIRVLENNSQTPVGQVFKQEPMGNGLLKKGEVIRLYISKGIKEELIEVPDVVNVDEKEAINALTSLGLKVGVVTRVHHDRYAKGKVIFITAKPREMVKKGHVVDVAVSLGEEVKTRELAYQINSPFGPNQSSGHLKVTLTQDEQEKVLYNKEVTSQDFPLSIKAEGQGEGILTVYLDELKQYTKKAIFTQEETE